MFNHDAAYMWFTLISRMYRFEYFYCYHYRHSCLRHTCFCMGYLVTKYVTWPRKLTVSSPLPDKFITCEMNWSELNYKTCILYCVLARTFFCATFSIFAPGHLWLFRQLACREKNCLATSVPFVDLQLQDSHSLCSLTESLDVTGKSTGLCSCTANIAPFIAACNQWRSVEIRDKAASSFATACDSVSSPCVIQS